MNFDSSVLTVPIEDIVPNRSQPRLVFDDGDLSDLAKSIKEHGIIQPLVLRRFGDKYEIIAGERRYRAAKLAGLAGVPAVIALIDDKTSAEVAVAENVARKPLTAIEEAKSYKALLDQGYMSVDQLAQKMGISVNNLLSKLKLLNLTLQVQDAIIQQKISERHGRSLLVIPDDQEQIAWLNKIIDERLTVRQLDEQLSQKYKGESGAMNIDIDQIKQNATDIQPSNMAASLGGDISAPIDLGSAAPGKFFNNLESQAASLQTTEMISDMSGEPNLGFGATSSVNVVDTTSPAPQLAPPTIEEPTVLSNTPAPSLFDVPVAENVSNPVPEVAPAPAAVAPTNNEPSLFDVPTATPVADTSVTLGTTQVPATDVAPVQTLDAAPTSSAPSLFDVPSATPTVDSSVTLGTTQTAPAEVAPAVSNDPLVITNPNSLNNLENPVDLISTPAPAPEAVPSLDVAVAPNPAPIEVQPEAPAGIPGPDIVNMPQIDVPIINAEASVITPDVTAAPAPVEASPVVTPDIPSTQAPAVELPLQSAAPAPTPEAAPAIPSIEPVLINDNPAPAAPTQVDIPGKINALIEELKAAGVNVQMSSMDMPDQTIFNIVVKKAS